MAPWRQPGRNNIFLKNSVPHVRTVPYCTIPYGTVPYRTVQYRNVITRTEDVQRLQVIGYGVPYGTVPYLTTPYRTVPVPYRYHLITVPYHIRYGTVPVRHFTIQNKYRTVLNRTTTKISPKWGPIYLKNSVNISQKIISQKRNLKKSKIIYLEKNISKTV